jgi:hypothetical protein
VLLEASLSREALADEDIKCQQCDKGNFGTWRCKDCSMGISMCRGCICRYHIQNPFHRIEKWNKQFFRPVDLWEVGTYLLVRHHNWQLACDVIQSQVDFLEMMEEKKDLEEQDDLKTRPVPTFTSTKSSSSAYNSDFFQPAKDFSDADVEMDSHEVAADDIGDEEFFRYIQELQDADGRESGERKESEGNLDAEDDTEEDEVEEPEPIHYLPNVLHAEYHSSEGSAQRVMGMYVRVSDLPGPAWPKSPGFGLA